MIQKSNLKIKKIFLTAIIAVCFSITTIVSDVKGKTSDKQRLNVLLIITDQQSVNALSCAGNPYLKTPALDSIAERGIRFERSYCTYPLCSPSRASIFTSRMPHEVGVNSNRKAVLPDGIPTMGTLFKEAGYETAYAGKWHLPDSYPAYSTKTKQSRIPGFDVLSLDGELQSYGKNAGSKGMEIDPKVAEAAIKYLKTPHSKPFLLVCSILNPHDICAYPQYPESFAGINLSQPFPPLAPNSKAFSDEPELVQIARTRRHMSDWSEDQWRRYRAMYYRLTEIADSHIARILSTLETAKLDRNTIIVCTADHGELMGAHQLMHKSFFYEEAVAVPLIVAAPGSKTKNRVDSTHLVSGLDILPTICDYAGIDTPASLKGTSLRPLIEGRSTSWRDYLIGEVGDGKRRGRMVLSERYKYIVYETGANPEQLFDRETDPGETTNLATNPASIQVLKKQRYLLNEFLKKTQDTFVIPVKTE